MGSYGGNVLTFSPDAVRVNPSRDSDAAKRLWDFVVQAADAGRPVVVSANERTYSLSEAAGLLGASVSTLQRSINDGTLSATKKGAYWRISESQMEQFRQYRMHRLAQLLADELDFEFDL